ncbi:MAG: hypothetical protein AAFR11_05770 [Pseudomonadota bacterium]
MAHAQKKLPAENQPGIKISRAAEAAGIPVATARTWYARGHIFLREYDQDSGESGSMRLLSVRSAIQLCLAAELVRLGISSSEAGQIAMQFAYGGGGYGNYGDEDLGPPVETRPNGGLFPDGETWLFVSRDRWDGTLHHSIVNVYGDFEEGLNQAMIRRDQAFGAIQLDEFVSTARVRLGLRG